MSTLREIFLDNHAIRDAKVRQIPSIFSTLTGLERWPHVEQCLGKRSKSSNNPRLEQRPKKVKGGTLGDKVTDFDSLIQASKYDLFGIGWYSMEKLKSESIGVRRLWRHIQGCLETSTPVHCVTS